MPTELPFYQVDAFTRVGQVDAFTRVGQVDAFTRAAESAAQPFTGNPAAVCPLDAWLPDGLMQAIAMENNLSETAFLVPEGAEFRLRWFTPTREVDLCGHATLASAAVVFSHIDPRRIQVEFETRSGTLTVRRAWASEGLPPGSLVMDFPALPPVALATVPDDLVAALGARPVQVLAARDLVVAVFADADAVRGLRPDLAAVSRLATHGVIATAPGAGDDGDVDFVSRFFAPKQGVPEDPVTGSAHCTLTPYWAERLGRAHLRARQVSARGGELACTLEGDRVRLAGTTRLVIRGQFLL
jgi:PhzF family phenazine biosynthesis protein